MDKNELKKIRKETGLTQKLFAEKIGVSKVLVTMTETGQKRASLNYIQKISNGLNKEIKITFKPINYHE